ncbi:hypothetical protein [Nocardioides jensenii]|uniref:hypothetical protein n=1 Tax=Nocardioides jensenii TaxID=1843 RepID=UPI00082A3AE6|nr:hypothetical protein [Nocardioides jensenii]
MPERTPSSVAPAIFGTVFAVSAVILGTIVTEVVARESVRFESEIEDPVFVWFLQGLAPMGQTGLINDGADVWWVPGCLLGLVALAVVTFGVTWLGVNGARTGVVALLTSWFGVVLAAGLGGLVSAAAHQLHFQSSSDVDVVGLQVRIQHGLVGGYYWGVLFGFFVGLVVLVAWSVRRPRMAAFASAPPQPSAGQQPVAPSTNETGNPKL